MKKRRVPYLVLSLLLCTAAVALLLLLCDASGDAQTTTRYVAPDGACGGASPCYSTIQDAVDAASAGDTIKVAQGVYTGRGFQVVYIGEVVTLTGGYTRTNWVDSYPEAQPTVIDAENVGRRRGVYVHSTDPMTITLKGFTITQGNSDCKGGGIIVYTGTLLLEDSKLLNNHATGGYGCSGGGVRVEHGTVTLRDNVVQGNSAHEGGGLAAATSKVVLDGNTFEANEQTVVTIEKADARLTGNTFKNNRSGTVVGIHESTASLCYNTFQDNEGRGLYFDATGEITENVFQNNRGGGVHLSSWDLIFLGNVLQSNAASSGGGLYIQGHTSATIHGNVFRDNSATQGGGFYIGGVPTITPPTITLSDNVFQGNSATESGGGGFTEMGTFTITGNTFERNSSNGAGGGLQLGPAGWGFASATLVGNTFRGNSAVQGGGLKIEGKNTTLGENTFLANSASSSGSGIYIKSSTVRAQNDIIANNITPWEAVYLSDSALSARHWTLANNGDYALTTAGSSTAVLSNTLVAFHELAGFWGPGITADHTLFFATGITCGGGASCTNSLAGNPRFINPDSGDYHIGPDSAAANTGIDAGVSIDIDGEPRPMGPGYDIGADEVRMGPFLAVAKSATPDPVQPGAQLAYTLYVTNTGTVSLTTTITDVLPSQVTPTGIVTWQPPRLLPTQVWSETILVTVETGYLGPLTNVVQVSSEEGATGSYTHTVLSMKGIYLPVAYRTGP